MTSTAFFFSFLVPGFDVHFFAAAVAAVADISFRRFEKADGRAESYYNLQVLVFILILNPLKT